MQFPWQIGFQENFYYTNYVLLFFTNFKSWMNHNNILKISDVLIEWNFVENLHPNYPPYGILHNLQALLLWENGFLFNFLF